MAPLSGHRTEWPEFPDWLCGYDFVVKASPTSSKPTPHIERLPYQPVQLVVRYHEVAPQSALRRGINRITGKRPLYFTSFAYQDPDHGVCEVTREELCSAFRMLVGAWQNLLYGQKARREAVLGKPFKHDTHIAASGQSLEEYATRGEGGLQIAIELSNAYQRLIMAADYFGQYLSYLSDMEDSGKLPVGWTRYPGPVDFDNVCRKSTDRYLISTGARRMDDYAFRAARLLQNVDKDTYHCISEEPLRKLRDSTNRVLEYKGYNEEEISSFLAAKPT